MFSVNARLSPHLNNNILRHKVKHFSRRKGGKKTPQRNTHTHQGEKKKEKEIIVNPKRKNKIKRRKSDTAEVLNNKSTKKTKNRNIRPTKCSGRQVEKQREGVCVFVCVCVSAMERRGGGA